MDKVRILIVDDEEGVRELAFDMAIDDGHIVVKAANGQEAQKKIQGMKPPIDIVITDHDMPQMDGTTLINWIKSEHPEIKVVLMSGRDARHPLADKHLSKPIGVVRELRSVIKSLREIVLAARRSKKK